LFIFQDIDHPQATVSLEQALDRLNVAGVVVGEKEKTNIRRAVKFRNLIVHYEFELNKFEWKKIYAQLFEFVHFFHVEHLKREMHLKIWRENHAVEARLMAYFRNNFVVYHDIEMHKDHPKEIVKAQRNTVLVSGDRRYQRIKYGDVLEWDDPQYAKVPCHDCYVLKGQYHTEGCDVEMCPKCRGQLMCCGCF
jgi:hypothetical protein